jgi:hypothetical protein
VRLNESDREASVIRRPWPNRGCCAMRGWDYTDTRTVNIVVGIVSRIRAGQGRKLVSIPGKSKIFFSYPKVETRSGAHPGSYRIGTGFLSPRIRHMELKNDHSSQSTAEDRNAWTSTSTPTHAFTTSTQENFET